MSRAKRAPATTLRSGGKLQHVSKNEEHGCETSHRDYSLKLLGRVYTSQKMNEQVRTLKEDLPSLPPTPPELLSDSVATNPIQLS